MHELLAFLHITHRLRIMSTQTKPEHIPVAEIVDACRKAGLPEEAFADLTVQLSASRASRAEIVAAIGLARDTMELARMCGFVKDREGATDDAATEAAAIELIKARRPLAEVQTRIRAALDAEDRRTARRAASPLDPWQARAVADAPKVDDTQHNGHALGDVWQQRRDGGAE